MQHADVVQHTDAPGYADVPNRAAQRPAVSTMDVAAPHSSAAATRLQTIESLFDQEETGQRWTTGDRRFLGVVLLLGLLLTAGWHWREARLQQQPVTVLSPSAQSPSAQSPSAFGRDAPPASVVDRSPTSPFATPSATADARAGADRDQAARTAANPTFEIDINAAGPREWAQLSGIGDILAQRIVDDRTTHGPFRSIDDVQRVKGIGAKTLDKMRPHLRMRHHASPD